MDQQTETHCPAGFSEVKQNSCPPLVVDKTDLPWMGEKDKGNIPLVEITLPGSEKFYFGNAVRGHLVELIRKFFERDPKANQEANDLFYSRLPGFIRGDRQDIKTIQHPITHRQVYYVAGHKGIRVYFMRFENRNGHPVIIRIAACTNKNQEAELIKIISSDKKL